VSKTSYRDRDDKSRYMTDRSFIRFKESVWAVQSEDDFPPMASFFESANGAAEGDDDVEMTSRGPRSLRCPLTLTRLVEPVRSRKCPHTFSKAAILQMLKGHEKGCPVAGCPQRISPADLEQDRITERLLEQAANRELDNEGPDGGDQVDESGQAGDDFLVL
jgi:SUMO ligase MMS21 Smc5/6 complex component